MGGILLHIIGLDASELAWQKCRGKSWRDARPPGDCGLTHAIRLKRNRVDFLFSYWFEASVILTDLLSLDHTVMAMSGRSLRQLGAYGRYGCISEIVWQCYPPGDICWYELRLYMRKRVCYLSFCHYFVFDGMCIECICIFRFSDIIIFTPISHKSEIIQKHSQNK